MKLQLFASTAAVLFSAFSGSVSATSLRGVSTTSDAVDSSDYYPEVEYYDSDSADYYPESGDYDFDYEDDEEEDPDDVDFVSNYGYNRARARQQARRFGIDSGRPGSNRAYNTDRARLERHGIIRRSGSSRSWSRNHNRSWNSNGNRIRSWNSNGRRSGSTRISSSGRRICPSYCRINRNGRCICN